MYIQTVVPLQMRVQGIEAPRRGLTGYRTSCACIGEVNTWMSTEALGQDREANSTSGWNCSNQVPILNTVERVMEPTLTHWLWDPRRALPREVVALDSKTLH